MISMQPTKLWTYLKAKGFQVPKHLNRFFYASWEDALWDLIRQLPIPSGSKVLVPEFFCGDVVDNMANHGLEAVWYPVDQNFETSIADFRQRLKEERPAVVIIFHAVGITNRLWSQSDKWIDLIDSNTLLIEDSVHRVVNPNQVKLITPRHIVMDSLRKVVPLAGCNVYTKAGEIALTPTAWWKTVPYQAAVYGWWLVFQVCLHLAAAPFGSAWQTYWNNVAEKTMLRGYDVIGDSSKAGSGWPLFSWLAGHLDFSRISMAKERQVRIYQEILAPLAAKASSSFFFPSFPASDAGLIRGFPLGIKLKHAHKALETLRQAGILTRFELNDSPWSQRSKVVYLPLGPHLQDEQVRNLARQCLSLLQS